jgi:GNAT superfamily N-acetyltransferase
MTDSVVIRRFNRSDESRAVGLLVAKLKPSQRRNGYEKRLTRWRWQYYENPKNPDAAPTIWVAQVGNTTAGIIGMLPVTLRTPMGMVNACWGVDLVVDPTFRGMGIGKMLVNSWKETFPIALGRGWSREAHSIETKSGFKTITGFYSASLPLSYYRFTLSLLKSGQYRRLLDAARPLLRRSPAAGTLPQVTITTGSILPADISGFWNRVAGAYTCCVERDEAYLRWRFLSHPTHKYLIHEARCSGEIVGYVISRMNEDTPALAVISEMIVDPSRPDVLSSVIDEMIAFYRAEGASAAAFDLTPGFGGAVMQRTSQALKNEFGIIVYTKIPRYNQAGIYDSTSWYLSRGDSDTDF